MTDSNQKPLVPNYVPDVGRLVTDRFDFQQHIDGTAFNHNASAILTSPTITINGDGYSNVQTALAALAQNLIIPTISNATTTSVGLIQLSGDITGTATAVRVSAIRGIPVQNLTPTTNQVLGYNGSSWTPTTLAAGWAGPTVATTFTIPIPTHTYTVSATDLFIFLNAGIVSAQTIILPTPTTGRNLIIKATSAIGTSGNVITLVPHGSETIEGLANLTTTVSAASNGVTLTSVTTINVASTVGFPSTGTIYVVSTTGTQPIVYGSTTPTSFIPTGASSPTGVINTGNSVNASTYIYVTDFGTLRLVCDGTNWWIW
jgi:Repeat of unknown function (DUF5907)